MDRPLCRTLTFVAQLAFAETSAARGQLSQTRLKPEKKKKRFLPSPAQSTRATHTARVAINPAT